MKATIGLAGRATTLGKSHASSTFVRNVGWTKAEQVAEFWKRQTIAFRGASDLVQAKRGAAEKKVVCAELRLTAQRSVAEQADRGVDR